MEKNKEKIENNIIKERIEELNLNLNKALSDILIDGSYFYESVNSQIFNDLLFYKPTSENELEDIDSTTEKFNNKFGKKVISIINRYINSLENDFSIIKRITPEIREAMEILNFRNNNLSSKNPLIYKSKSSKEEDELLIKSNELKELVLKDIFEKNDEKIWFDSELHQKEMRIMREKYHFSLEQDRIAKLYLSIGKLSGNLSNKIEKIKVDAPLLFFPIKLESNDIDDVLISFDKTRSIEINKDIILANNKLKKVNTKIINNAFSEIKSFTNYKEESVMQEIFNFYKNNGVPISTVKINKHLTLTNEVTLGIYQIYKNPTQIDLTWILNNGFITENIEKLFSKKEEESKINELTGNVSEEIAEKKRELIENNEYESSFISKINYPQDKAVKGIKIHDNIVIQGPPGTGKTEVITSIIADSVIRGKKILVSSERLSALDVVKSRMAELSKYVILFNKNLESSDFYDQINFMISESVKDKANQSNSSLIKSDNEILFNRQEARREIIEYMKNYQTIFQYLKSNEIGKTYSFLYKNHSGHRTTEPEIKKILSESGIIEIIRINKLFVPKLYDILYLLNQKFSSKKENNEFDLDKAVLDKYPFLLTHTKTRLTERKIKQTLNSIERESDETLFDGDEFSSKAKSILKNVFIDVIHLTTYLKTKNEILIVVGALDKKYKQKINKVDGNEANNIYNSLGASWSKTFHEISELFISKSKSIKPDLISNVIFDHTIQEILNLKESSNQELQKNISNGNISTFNQMISNKLSEIVDQNISLTGRKLRDKLIDILIESGKMNEIQSISENRKSFNVNKFMDIYWKEIFEAVGVWLLPTDNVSEFFPLVPQMFDIVIIDEASQVQVEKAIPLMFRAKKLVISGDDKQLKPSVNSDEIIYFDEQEMNWNDALMPPLGLQDALKNKFSNYLLNYHYRSKFTELISFSNTFFYNKNLYTSTPRSYENNNPPINFIKVKNAKSIAGKNALEANAVIKEIVKCIKKDNSKTIGVIAFTDKQKEIILEKLENEASKNNDLDLYIRSNLYGGDGEDTSLFVKNVEDVQGDERDIIIFSTTFSRNSNGEFPKDLGSISKEHGENSLNVALTRSKEKIIVCSSLDPNDLTLNKKDVGGQLLKHFLYYAQAFKTKNENSIRRILRLEKIPQVKVFESRMHEEIYNLISNAGYDVEYNYGLDNYKIDFAIRNESGDIILGINLDNKQYLRNFNTMEREYYLPTYLEARGWNVIRVWSHQWSKDPTSENERILKSIKDAIDTFGKGKIISLFGSGKRILDFNVDDYKYEDVKIDEVVNDSEKMINERYENINSIVKQVVSEKHKQEESKWLSEYEAIEAKSSQTSEEELGMVIDNVFKKNKDSKSIEGIEDPEINELIRLSETNKKGGN